MTQAGPVRRGTAAGVPFVAVPPSGGIRPGADVVVAWHMMAPPCTEPAFAAAVPMAGVDAWRIYLGVAMTGAREAPGGPAEIQRLLAEDAVLRVFEPIIRQAVDEFPAAY